MTPKLRPIRTTARAASVKRRDVTSAAKAVIVTRESCTGRFIERKSNGKRTTAGSRK
ncbi:MAG: hypothetical protein M3041_08535 [Acidobacteriota bacterium]|nr:hypothetical protein [Acidobacteriota bacterium]